MYFLIVTSIVTLTANDCFARYLTNNPDISSILPPALNTEENGKTSLVAATYYFNPNSPFRRESLHNELLNENLLSNKKIEQIQQCHTADNRKGSCYEASECMRKGGTPMGRCGEDKSNSLVCCLFEITCGEYVSEQYVYFRNPGYPDIYDKSRVCRVRIGKQDKNICQYRIDFLHFHLSPPNYGNCSKDVFIVSGQNENNLVPKICGHNTGQHYYFNVDEAGIVTLHMLFLGYYKRKFDILITQISCEDHLSAPSNCLQYYTKTHGSIQSFNYENEFISENDATIGYPNDIDYIMCIKKESGFCSISYDFNAITEKSNGGPVAFAVGSSSGITERSATNFARPITAQCSDDYLSISGMRLCSGQYPLFSGNQKAKAEETEDGNHHSASSSVSLTSSSMPTSSTSMISSTVETMLNASILYPAVITDNTPGPFVIRFVSNHAYNARGFNLTYKQNPCK